jgi:hypothetical protein
MAPRPDLNGLRVQQYGDPSVYLIDEGVRGGYRVLPLADLGWPDGPDISWP